MKRVLMLVGTLALIAGANAQVKQTVRNDISLPVSDKTMVAPSPILTNPGKAAAKAGAVDTIYTEPVYRVANNTGGSYYLGYSATGLPAEGWDAVNNIPAVFFTMGSGWASHHYGSGEFGYSFDFTERGWYYIMDMPFASWGITGAILNVGRARSSVTKMNEKEMPLRFKLYTSEMGQVGEQVAYDNMTNENKPVNEINVVYPYDPEKFVSYSETVGVGIVEPTGSQRIGSKRYGAKFLTPGIAGENACVSVIFPTEYNDEDTLWNATTYEVMDGAGNVATSSRIAPMYVVYDFLHQNMWGQREGDEFIYNHTGVRHDGFVADSTKQPNKRYGIVPMMSWAWADGTCMDGEFDLMIVVADGVTIERGASYDKYVEVRNNPAIDYTVLQSADRIQKVELYNLSGKLVKTQACNDNIVEVRLDGLSSGMYVAKVTTDGGVANKKIMIR